MIRALLLALILAGLASLQEKPVERFPARTIEHPERVVALGGDRDGKLLVLADATGGAALWDLAKDERRWERAGRGAPIVDLVVGEDVAVFSFGVSAYGGFELDDGAELPGQDGPDPRGDARSSSIAISAKDRWIWLGMDGGVLRLTPGDADGWKRRKIDHRGTSVLALDPQDSLLAVGGRDGTLRFVGVKSTELDERKTVEAHASKVTALCFDAKGGQVLSGGADGTARLTDVSTGKASLVIADQGAEVTAVACDPKARWLAVAYADGALRLFAAKDGALLAELAAAGSEPVVDLVAGAKGASLAAARGKRVTIWDLASL